MIFLETSAKTSKNVDRAFEMCTNAVIAKVDNGVIDVNKNGSGILQNDRKAAMINSKETSNIDQKIDLLKFGSPKKFANLTKNLNVFLHSYARNRRSDYKVQVYTLLQIEIFSITNPKDKIHRPKFITV